MQKILSQYSCPLNSDVETFLTGQSAIVLEKQDISKTFIVFSPHKNIQKIAGYFTIAIKGFVLAQSKIKISNMLKKRISKFGQYNKHLSATCATREKLLRTV